MVAARLSAAAAMLLSAGVAYASRASAGSSAGPAGGASALPASDDVLAFLLLKSPRLFFLCACGYALHVALKVRALGPRSLFWGASFLKVLVGAFGGGICVPLALGKPPGPFANDAVVTSTLIAWWIAHRAPSDLGFKCARARRARRAASCTARACARPRPSPPARPGPAGCSARAGPSPCGCACTCALRCSAPTSSSRWCCWRRRRSSRASSRSRCGGPCSPARWAAHSVRRHAPTRTSARAAGGRAGPCVREGWQVAGSARPVRAGGRARAVPPRRALPRPCPAPSAPRAWRALCVRGAGQFLPFDKGLGPVEKGFNWVMLSAFATALSVHLLLHYPPLSEAAWPALSAKGSPDESLCRLAAVSFLAGTAIAQETLMGPDWHPLQPITALLSKLVPPVLADGPFKKKAS